jgi:large subunit ribosomal protein L25
MSELLVLKAERRDRAGKGAARATRRTGVVPGVIYGNKESPELITLDPKPLEAAIKKRGFYSTVMAVELAGKKQQVLPRDVQLDPVTDRPVHFDFLRITKDSILEVMVPVTFVNEGASPGLKKGGVLNIVRHEVGVRCKPDAIPQKLEFDLTGLEIGNSIHISAIKLPAGVVPVIRDRDFTVATIAPPTVVREEEETKPAAAADAAAAPAAGTAAPAAGAAAAPAAGAAGAKPAAGAAPAKAPAGGDKGKK